MLHAAAAVCLFLLLRQLTGATWLSAWVAAVFAVHPLRAESVAWVAERKDVLSGLFFMLTLSAYAYYARRPFAWTRYLAVVVLLALGLMSKPMLVTLPCVLMLLDYWPLGRLAGLWADRRALNRCILEKIPLMALSAASCMATIEAGTVAIHEFSPSQRIANALVSYVGYLGHLFYPVRLAVYYPYPEGDSLAWKAAGAAALLVVISVIAVLRRRKQPWLLVGWLWYLGMMVPVIGLIQVGGQAMADRYTYLTQIGLLAALAWTAADMFRGRLARRVAIVFGLASVLILTVTAWQQTSTWRNNETLWRHAVASTTRNFRAHNYLGITLSGQQRLDEAIEQFEKALAIQPYNTEANGNIGIALVQRGRLDEAIDHYRKGLTANPTCAEIHNNLGNALIRKGAVRRSDRALPGSGQAAPRPAGGLLQSRRGVGPARPAGRGHRGVPQGPGATARRRGGLWQHRLRLVPAREVRRGDCRNRARRGNCQREGQFTIGRRLADAGPGLSRAAPEPVEARNARDQSEAHSEPQSGQNGIDRGVFQAAERRHRIARGVSPEKTDDHNRPKPRSGDIEQGKASPREQPMSSTYTSLNYHIVFGTKGRRPFLAESLRSEVYRYMGGIIANKQGRMLEIGGIDDHVHLLTSCSPTIALADFVRDIKANSSKWLREDKRQHEFQWQIGYGAFTVSLSRIDAIRQYVRNQPEHHRRRSFAEEFRAILQRHGISCDERDPFDGEHFG